MTTLGDNVYAVILAGGSGTRFWPKSRQLSPKQLCAIGNAKETMLETTLKRLDGFIAPDRRLIVTHEQQIESTKQIAGAACPHYLAEPDARNTANALALAALDIETRHQGADTPIMISLHADHVIENVDAFKQSVRNAIDSAKEGYLCLLGIVPDKPETGYGYIERGASLSETAFKVSSFREKPELELAKSYLESCNFLWNAGIFVWSIPTIIAELDHAIPTAMNALRGLKPEAGVGFRSCPSESLRSVYQGLPKISIDHAVLEVSKKVSVVDADIGWQDIGSWDALAKTFPTDQQNNISFGNTMLIDCEGVTADSDGDLVACLGLKDIVVVKAKGAVLVCPADKAQDVKKIVEALKADQNESYL